MATFGPQYNKFVTKIEILKKTDNTLAQSDDGSTASQSTNEYSPLFRISTPKGVTIAKSSEIWSLTEGTERLQNRLTEFYEKTSQESERLKDQEISIEIDEQRSIVGLMDKYF